MPLFGKKAKKDVSTEPPSYANATSAQGNPQPYNRDAMQPPTTAGNERSKNGVPEQTHARPQPPSSPKAPPRPKLSFQCQQAHGSPVGIISGFTNVKELYAKIAECYDFKPSDILFCTLNSHKVDMTKLLGGQIGLEDFIFVHLKGQPKEIDITKTEDALGLTITDNGNGYAFIKRIKENSTMDKMPQVKVGDHLEKINSTSLIGCRHFEVAKMLKEIPKGTTFTLRIVEPLKSGFSVIDMPYSKKKSGKVGSGKKTLRFRANGPAVVEAEPDDVSSVAVDKINGLLESFMGINDTELAQNIWEIGNKQENPHDFAMAVDASDLEAFGFADDFIFDLWGAINDAKTGRLNKQGFSENF
ncbi:PDZ domain-containing protein GIPC3 [Octopus sinensis]|uniref:PDZ domain-containing protein GIPC3 n=1 Tax=Octopus sinensis TaxID=2607531 RepID=A0A6P7T1A0_9MOLL|nr:PDZ domain-containing protein GIPC3 [Octopus sinensis]